MFVENLFRDPAYFANVVVIVMISIGIHEYFHALAALSQGDDTAARQGRLTLNPLLHMGQASVLMLVLFGIAWGETPVNRARFKHPLSPALVAFAGPFANLLMMIVCVFGALVLQRAGASGTLADATQHFLSLAALMNAFLFLLNMIPLPPLDGFGVLETFLPPLRRYAVSLSQYGFLILVVLFLFFGLGGFLMGMARFMVGMVVSFALGIV
ncbi:MAG: peptidase [Vampirovibrio sp.]|jgi:Zn-dependent protease|nr:peptidase [Vampirovibrio sp.]